MLKKLFEKTLKLASHKSSKLFLAIISFAESSFFPIPPDIMIIPMVIAKKIDYLKIFLIATIFSTLGGLLGYLIGSTFIDLAMNVVNFYGYVDKVLELKSDFTNNTNFYIFLAALFLAGFTPLPFKVFTITSGIIGFNIFLFFFICLFSRGLRFFVVSYLAYKLGDSFSFFLKENNSILLKVFSLIVVVIAVSIYFVIKYV
jgi:membrane protein YqaA with SNARE-associated domain